MSAASARRAASSIANVFPLPVGLATSRLHGEVPICAKMHLTCRWYGYSEPSSAGAQSFRSEIVGGNGAHAGGSLTTASSARVRIT